MSKKEPLCWNVYVENINGRQIKIYNIFNHRGFSDGIDKIFKKEKQKLKKITAHKDFKNFLENLKNLVHNELGYYFWSKCEWEIVLSDWPPSDHFNKEKIDVSNQVDLNFDIFFKYLCEYYNIRENFKNE